MVVVTLISLGSLEHCPHISLVKETNNAILNDKNLLLRPYKKQVLVFNTIMGHVFPDKTQTGIAHLVGFGAMTRSGVRGVLMVNTAGLSGHVSELSNHNASDWWDH